MKRTLLSLIMSNSSLAGRFDWLRGWVFIGLVIVGQTLSTLYIGCKDPELLRRRSQIGQGTKTWDLVLLALFGLTFLAIPIVKDRNHRVIESGPYRIIRHPGYTATLLGLVLATPLLLGSWWAFIPAILAMLCLILRTALEDRTLRQELSGYEAYTRKVRYRLLPGIW